LKKLYEKTFKSSQNNLPEIEIFILDSISELELSVEKRNNIELAAAEAAANCILHGNKKNNSKNVIIKIELTDKKLLLKFKDEGEGFDPEKVPDPTMPENILRGSGRGLHIMKSLVDKINYVFSDHGTELVLTINL
jgi:serine/threonine-protein kinase RsbW